MNNEQARPTSQPTPSATSGKEDYMRYIARKRRKSKMIDIQEYKKMFNLLIINILNITHKVYTLFVIY